MKFVRTCNFYIYTFLPWQLASRGYNLLLVARGKEGLKQAATDIQHASKCVMPLVDKHNSATSVPEKIITRSVCSDHMASS